MKLEIKRGLDIPLQGIPSSEVEELKSPTRIALNLEPFDYLLFKLLAKVGDQVQIGQPLLENKAVKGQFFLSPAGGVIKEIRRGLKRRLLDIVIEVSENETHRVLPALDPKVASKEELIERLLQGGLFPYIQRRPFPMIASPSQTPRDIFVNAVESAPYTPSAEKQIKGFERFFQAGLSVLGKLTEGKVHLIYPATSSYSAFTEAQGVEKHQMKGPHPAGCLSFAIHKIAPIRHAQEVVWTLSAQDVVIVGRMVTEGTYHIDRKVAVGGEGILPSKRKIYQTRAGIPLANLLDHAFENGKDIRIVSGDPLMGQTTTLDDFIGFHDRVVSVLIENRTQEALHFFRLGSKKFTATRTYLSGHKSIGKERYHFTTNQHGEERAFIDGNVYDKVMPLPIPTMMLVKSILAEDFGVAEELGILEVAPEDFALPTFICPSKIEMVEIVKQGLRRHAVEVGIV